MYPCTYKWLRPAAGASMPERMSRLRAEISALPQYEPKTEHYFHGGMYVRKVYRDANVCLVGRVHKKEHFYIVVSGEILVTDGVNEPQHFKAGDVICSMPGTQRSVVSITPAVTLTVHKTRATTVEQAEAELCEDDQDSMYLPGNIVKPGVLKHDKNEVLQ